MAKRPTVRVTVTKRAYDTGAVGAATDHGVRLGPARAEALVLSVNEKSQIQALDRTAPVLPMTFGAAGARTITVATARRRCLPHSTSPLARSSASVIDGIEARNSFDSSRSMPRVRQTSSCI